MEADATHVRPKPAWIALFSLRRGAAAQDRSTAAVTDAADLAENLVNIIMPFQVVAEARLGNVGSRNNNAQEWRA